MSFLLLLLSLQQDTVAVRVSVKQAFKDSGGNLFEVNLAWTHCLISRVTDVLIGHFYFWSLSEKEKDKDSKSVPCLPPSCADLLQLTRETNPLIMTG